MHSVYSAVQADRWTAFRIGFDEQARIYVPCRQGRYFPPLDDNKTSLLSYFGVGRLRLREKSGKNHRDV